MSVRAIDANALVRSLENMVSGIEERGGSYVLTLLPRTLIDLLNDQEATPTIACQCCGEKMEQKDDSHGFLKASNESLLKDVPTKRLVEELMRREGVETKEVAPHEYYNIAGTGACILLEVKD